MVYRAKFVPTVFAARQFVNHGHVKVNGKRVNIPCYRVKVGDVVEVKETSKQLALVLEAKALAERDVPDYIEVDHNKMTAKLARIPALGRRALPGADGAEPGRRVLFALMLDRADEPERPPSQAAFLHFAGDDDRVRPRRFPSPAAPFSLAGSAARPPGTSRG